MSEEGKGEKDKQHIQWWNREFFETLTEEVADELGGTLEYVFGQAGKRPGRSNQSHPSFFSVLP